jgi:hypothetical protein
MKKGWLIGCGVAAVLGGLLCVGIGLFFFGIFSSVMTMTQPLVDASDEFLGLLGQGKIAEAYAATASGFQAQQDELSFATAVKQLGLTDYASASWTNRQLKNQEGSVEGTVTTKQGGKTPIAIQLIVESGKWKVVGVRYGGVELTSIKAPKEVPAQAELARMANTALLDFNDAVQAKDFTKFLGKTSSRWQKQTTAPELQKIFQEFIDKNVNIAGIKDVQPQFEPMANINDEGLLLLKGHYPTQPAQVQFALKYVRELEGWKLIGVEVKVGPKN